MTARNSLILNILGIILCVFVLFYFGLGNSYQEKIYDRFFIQKYKPSDVIIIGIDNDSINQIGKWPFERAAYAKVLSYLDETEAVGIDVVFQEQSPLGEQDGMALLTAVKKFPKPLVLPVQFDDRGGKLSEPTKTLKPYVRTGFVNVLLDNDGIVRRFERFRGSVPSFDEALLLGSSSVPLNESSKNTTSTGTLDKNIGRIDYQGPRETFTTLSFIDVYQGKIPASVFKDKTIFIGVTSEDLHDTFQTPLGVMSGVELHANIFKTLENGTSFREFSAYFVFLMILITVALPAMIVRRLKHIWMLILFILAGILIINLLSIFLFGMHVLIPNVYLTLAFIIAVGSTAIIEYVSQYREKQFIRKTFQYYLMPDVISEIVANPKKLKLGGERKKVTILFSDIRGFTTLSEGLSPENLTHIINEYLTGMTDVIMSNKGLVDKYIGDAIMAFWGAPLANQNQARDACKAVLEMSGVLQKLNEHWQTLDLPVLGIGIGLNTGEVVVGNMGSETRFNYTIMGDEVNFGSRLEGLNKSYGTECLISESTQREIAGDPQFVTRELDLVIVKGKKEPKLIFELVTKPMTEGVQKILASFSEGRKSYLLGDFDDAIRYFEQALLLGPDGPSTTFLARCKTLKINPPQDWKGVFEFKSK